LTSLVYEQPIRVKESISKLHTHNMEIPFIPKSRVISKIMGEIEKTSITF